MTSVTSLKPPIERLLYSIPETTVATGISRATLFRAMRAGGLRATRIGRRTMIARAELERFIQAHSKGGA